MAPPSRSSSSSPGSPPSAKREVAVPRPSSSVIVVSDSNEVLLLQRVAKSSSFASAHVFPGGNLDAFHDGEIPGEDSPDRHRDCLPYRLAAIRECFEESGILLTKNSVSLTQEERDKARRRIHANEISFLDYLKSIDAEADTDGLIPCTRWITPANLPKRYTTQMYIYLLPLTRSNVPSETIIPTPDDGVEHTSAVFAPPNSFLARAATKSIIIFPPQVYLLHLLTQFLSTEAGATTSLEETALHARLQRKKLRKFLAAVPTAKSEKGKAHPTARIAWADKVMSPFNLFVREEDQRAVLALDKPGPELKGSDRGGDWERVVLVKFTKRGPVDVVIRNREEVLEEEKAAKAGQEKL